MGSERLAIIALLGMLLYISSSTACRRSRDCDQGQCCATVSTLLGKRGISDLLRGSRVDGTCKAYTQEGEQCGLVDAFNGLCGCESGLGCYEDPRDQMYKCLRKKPSSSDVLSALLDRQSSSPSKPKLTGASLLEALIDNQSSSEIKSKPTGSALLKDLLG